MEFSPLTVVVGNDASGKTGIQVSGRDHIQYGQPEADGMVSDQSAMNY